MIKRRESETKEIKREKERQNRVIKIETDI